MSRRSIRGYTSAGEASPKRARQRLATKRWKRGPTAQADAASEGDLVGRLDAGDRATWGPLALGATLAIAGLYQLTPLKRVCLDHCRSPMGRQTRSSSIRFSATL